MEEGAAELEEIRSILEENAKEAGLDFSGHQHGGQTPYAVVWTVSNDSEGWSRTFRYIRLHREARFQAQGVAEEEGIDGLIVPMHPRKERVVVDGITTGVAAAAEYIWSHLVGKPIPPGGGLVG